MGKRFADERAAKDDGRGADFYVGKEERAALIADKTELEVTAVEFQAGMGWGNSDRYLVTVVIDGEERGIGFGTESVQSRDRKLGALEAFLESEDDVEPTFIVLSKAGRATLVNVVGVESGE